jgi:hypothetical protein
MKPENFPHDGIQPEDLQRLLNEPVEERTTRELEELRQRIAESLNHSPYRND